MTAQGGTGTNDFFGFIQLGFDLFQARLPLFYIVSALVDRFGNLASRQIVPQLFTKKSS
jgi:hypothetical protein